MDKKIQVQRLGFFGAGGGTRTHTMSPSTDFESVTSANSITPAYLIAYVLYMIKTKKSILLQIFCLNIVKYNSFHFKIFVILLYYRIKFIVI